MSTAGTGTERSAIAGRAGLVAVGTLGSRLLGAGRDAVIAATFAVGVTDLFWMAFTIPNALRVLLGEGAVSGAFVPVFTEVREREGMARARLFLARLSGAMLLILLGVTVAGVLFARPLVSLYAWGFRSSPERFETTVTLARMVFPYIFFMGAAALVTGALNAMKRFAAPAFAPALLNVALIAAPFALVPVATALGLAPVAALALGALLGGLLQLAAQLPSLRRVGLLSRPTLEPTDPYVKKAFRLLVPLLIALGVYQLNIILSRQLTSFLPEGSLSYLYYGQRLVEIPQGMFALAIATASLPTLAEKVAQGDHAEAKATFRYALGLTLFVALPATVALAVLAEPTVAVLFGRGRFGSTEIVETGRSLVWQAAGIWAVASVRTVVPMFHAYNDTRTPVVASAVNLVVFGAVASLLMGPLAHVGLAIAISTAAAAQLFALLWLLRLRAGRLGLRSLLASVSRMVAASAVMAVVLRLVIGLGRWTRGGNDPRNLGVFALAVGVGGASYLLSAHLFRVHELVELVDGLRRRFGR